MFFFSVDIFIQVLNNRKQALFHVRQSITPQGQLSADSAQNNLLYIF